MKYVALCVMCLLSIGGPLGISQDNAKAIYKDPHAAIPDRVSDLLGRMTIEEKVTQLESGWVLPAMAGMSSSTIFDKGQLNEASAQKLAANGLGTYAFLDEFTSTGDTKNPRTGAVRRNLL